MVEDRDPVWAERKTVVEGRDSEHDGHRDRGEHRESPKQVRGRYRGAGNSGNNCDIFKGLVNYDKMLLFKLVSSKYSDGQNPILHPVVHIEYRFNMYKQYKINKQKYIDGCNC